MTVQSSLCKTPTGMRRTDSGSDNTTCLLPRANHKGYAVKILQKLAVAAVVAGAAVVNVAMPAYAIDDVDCADRSDFLMIQLPDRTQCYANAGMMMVSLVSPEVISTGNNDVQLIYFTTSGEQKDMELTRNTVLRRADNDIPYIPLIKQITIR